MSDAQHSTTREFFVLRDGELGTVVGEWNEPVVSYDQEKNRVTYEISMRVERTVWRTA